MRKGLSGNAVVAELKWFVLAAVVSEIAAPMP